MTGPEHYREAEAELQRARAAGADQPDAEQFHLAAAQVHATLALAAATLEITPDGTWTSQPADWQRAIDGETTP